MDETVKWPGVGDVLKIVNPDGSEHSALVMGVEDDGSLVIQMPDGDTYQIRISPTNRNN